jgi:Type IV pilin-like G and H, putative
MVRWHWETLGTATLLTIAIGTATPATAQLPSPLALRQAEGGKAIAKLTRAQQAYYLENSKFSRTLPPLATGVPSSTLNYQQRIVVQNPSSVVHYAIARQPNLKSIVGRVVIGQRNNGEFTTVSIVCENNRIGMRLPAIPSIGPNLQLVCAPVTTEWAPIQTPAEAEAEARQQVGTMTRAQQAYFLENARFATLIEELGRGIRPETIGYSYSIVRDNQLAIQYGIARKVNLKSVVGAAAIVKTVDGEFTNAAIVCENIQPGTFRPAPPIVSANGQTLVCAAGTKSIGN